MNDIIKKKKGKSFSFIISSLLLLSIFLATGYLFWNYQKGIKKKIVENTSQEFEKTIELLNQINQTEKELDELSIYNPNDSKILEITERQIQEMKELVEGDNSVDSRIKKLERNTQEEDEKIKAMKDQLVSFYRGINIAYSKKLKYVDYFHSINQIIKFIEDENQNILNSYQNTTNEIVSNENNGQTVKRTTVQIAEEEQKKKEEINKKVSDMARGAQEKLAKITPPLELQSFHQNLLVQYNGDIKEIEATNNKETEDEEDTISEEELDKDFAENINEVVEEVEEVEIKESSEDELDLVAEINKLYSDLDKDIAKINEIAKNIKKMLIDEETKYGLSPLSIDIENWGK